MAERERLDATSPSSSFNSPESDTYKSCQYLTVDETKQPRANSDPVGLHFAIANLPQITVTGDDGQESDSKEDDEVDSFLGPPVQRPRANTCPDDMFRLRRGRPPTPPPTDIMKSPGGKKKFLFNFNTKDLNGISFTHHRLSKVSEDGGELATRSNQNMRPSHAARRASCLAALSEATIGIEEQKEEEGDDDEEKLPKFHLIQPGKSASSEIAAKPVSQQQQQQQTLEKNFQRIDINSAKSNLRSEGVDLGLNMSSPNIVTF